MALATAPPPLLARPRVVMIGTALAAGAIVMAFAGMLGVYLAGRAAVVDGGQTWLPPDANLPLQQPNVMMIGLIMGSVTIQWAAYAVGRDDRRNTYVALGVTALIGVAYVNMAAYLYSLMALDVDGAGVGQSVLIYSITGAHIAMVIGATVFAILMAFRALGGQYTSRQHDGISAAAMFWHVTTFVFFFIWLIIYVTK